MACVPTHDPNLRIALLRAGRALLISLVVGVEIVAWRSIGDSTTDVDDSSGRPTEFRVTLARQVGQLVARRSHGLMQAAWYRCEHGRDTTSSPGLKQSQHIAHVSAPVVLHSGSIALTVSRCRAPMTASEQPALESSCRWMAYGMAASSSASSRSSRGADTWTHSVAPLTLSIRTWTWSAWSIT